MKTRNPYRIEKPKMRIYTKTMDSANTSEGKIHFARETLKRLTSAWLPARI